MSEGVGGAAATTEAVRVFARSVSLKVDGGDGKTKTEHAIEQARAATAAEIRTGRSSLLAAGTASALLRIQARAKV
jgi:hypothetical protein